jgi:TfoX/Sxy family transcriptional regulator of competence genes
MAYNEELARRVGTLLKGQRGLEQKRMFGGVGFLIRGNMACGVHKEDLILRLSEADFEAALKAAHVRVFDLTGKPMKGWVFVSAKGCNSERALRDWVQKSVSFAKSLPPK